MTDSGEITWPLSHPCIEPGCLEEGMLGEDVCLRQGRLGTWRCSTHDKARHATRVEPTMPKSSLPQGRLGL